MADITPRKQSRITTICEHCAYAQAATAIVVEVGQKSVSLIMKPQKVTVSFTPRRQGKS